MKMIVTCTKRAWIRDSSYPAGSPAPGRFNCPCGQTPQSMLNENGPDVHCPCGTVFRWDGFVKQVDYLKGQL